MNAYWSYMAGMLTGGLIVLLTFAVLAHRAPRPGYQPPPGKGPPACLPNQGSGGKHA